MPQSQLFLPLEMRSFISRISGSWNVRSSLEASRAPGDQPEVWKHGILLRVVRRPRARRYLLRLETDGTARLVIPRRGSRQEAFRFLERSESWLLERYGRWQAAHAQRQPWGDGTSFLLRGETVVLRVATVGERVELRFADQILEAPAGGDYRLLVQARLRRLAERELPARTRELAMVHGIKVERVTIRAQKTRWGSCSARGTISLNWRLIQAPCPVQDYLIVHELMHRRQMNHSARFWNLVAAACPDYRAAERWLKERRLGEMD